MTKPEEYRAIYILAQDVAYQNTDTPTKGTHSGVGTLHRGRVVWLQNDLPATDKDSQISAYAEGVGLVSLTSAAIQPIVRHW